MSTSVLIISVVILFIFYFSMTYYFKNRTKKNAIRLAQPLLKGDYQKFDQMLKDPKIQKTVSPYQRYLLSFNSYLERHDGTNANSVFEKMNQLNLMSRQKVDFYGSAQNYYIESKDKKRAKICHEKLSSVRKYDEEKEYFNTIYQVMIENNTSYKKIIEGRLNFEEDHKKLPDLYLLKHIYQIKRQKDKIQECDQQIDQLIKKLESKNS